MVGFNVMSPEGSVAISEPVLLRVPMPKVDSTALIDSVLRKNGFEQVATMQLPLAFLPYSQLQINRCHLLYAITKTQYYREISGEEAHTKEAFATENIGFLCCICSIGGCINIRVRNRCANYFWKNGGVVSVWLLTQITAWCVKTIPFEF
ncbi:MAG: hypothetical protein R3E67_08195 [Pseudomonadales bacterium]